MSSVSELLKAEFEALKTEILAKYYESGLKASGNWGESLTIEASGNSVKITGEAYGDGRKPGKQPPSEAIEQWIKDKGLAARLEKSLSMESLAFLIARKIGREGWWPEGMGTSEIVESIVTPERIQQIIDKAGNILLVDLANQIINYFKPVP